MTAIVVYLTGVLVVALIEGALIFQQNGQLTSIGYIAVILWPITLFIVIGSKAAEFVAKRKLP